MSRRQTRPTFYQSASDLWPSQSTDSIIVECDSLDQPIFTLPGEFFQLGAQSPSTVSFLLYVVNAVTRIQGNFILLSGDGHKAEQCDPIRVGTYSVQFTEPNGRIQWRKGPQGKRTKQPFSEQAGDSSVSASSQATGRSGQENFREQLRTTHGRCVVSKKRWEVCVAAHIVPQSLGQELVDRLTGNRRLIGYMSVHNGLLLAADLHKAFDLYLWSIYWDQSLNCFVFHDFFGDFSQYHGQKIELQSMRSRPLLQWHYDQTLMARARAFTYWPSERDVPYE